MTTASRPKLFFAAIAATVLAARPATSLLISDQNHVARQTLGRPSFVQLDASASSNNRRPQYTELEKLTAKRLSIRRRRITEPDVDVAAEVSASIDEQQQSPTAIDLEYLYESGEERHSDDLFHIILMPSSFKKDFIPSVEYVAESCSEILGLRSDKAYDLSLFAKHEGFSLLGTWTREECLTMGEQLLERNLDCRVIPFNGGVEPIIGSTPAETRPSGTIDTFYLV